VDVSVHSVLRQCLADDVQLSPIEARPSLEVLVRRWPINYDGVELAQIADGRYSSLLEEVLGECVHNPKSDIESVMSTVAQYVDKMEPDLRSTRSRATADAVERMRSDDLHERVTAGIAVMLSAFNSATGSRSTVGRRRATGRPRNGSRLSRSWMESTQIASEWIGTESTLQERYVACWLLAWQGLNLDDEPLEAGVYRDLFALWRHSDDPVMMRMSTWALLALPLADPTIEPLGRLRGNTQFLRSERECLGRPSKARSRIDGRYNRAQASMLASYYFGGPWDLEAVRTYLGEFGPSKVTERLQRRLANIVP
jgi:hypothetical protein